MVITTISSKWKKDGKICTMCSKMENGNWEVFFNGYNPFPCFSMKTSMRVLTQWMETNGWEKIPGLVIRTREVKGEEKKYKCELALCAEEETTGEMELTEEEYLIVKRVADISNWKNLDDEPYSGHFGISSRELDKKFHV